MNVHVNVRNITGVKSIFQVFDPVPLCCNCWMLHFLLYHKLEFSHYTWVQSQNLERDAAATKYTCSVTRGVQYDHCLRV
jgi:hypothetical protein